MKVTTKALRTQAREVLDCVDRGEPVTITYRGKPRARLVAIEDERKSTLSELQEIPVFGMWADRKDLEDVPGYVRELRKGRRHVD
jgi:prevent-host-death family protein